jgi:hypothetical protein
MVPPSPSLAVTRRLTLTPSKAQTILELFVGVIDDQIRDTMQVEPSRYRALIGTIFIFILLANWSSLIPGVEPPTAHVETDAAFAAIVFCATILYGIRSRGLFGYLRTFAEPTWIMIPLNIVEQITHLLLIVRLFGNMMSRRSLARYCRSRVYWCDPLWALARVPPAISPHLHRACNGLHRAAVARGARISQQPQLKVSMFNTRQLISIFSAAMVVLFGAIGPALGEGRQRSPLRWTPLPGSRPAGTVSRTLFVGSSD